MFVFVCKFQAVSTPKSNIIDKAATPQDTIIDTLELVIGHQRKEIFDLKEEIQMLKIQLKAMTEIGYTFGVNTLK